MPDITTPSPLTYTGGALRTKRLVPSLLAFTPGSVTSSKDTPTSAAAVIPKLDRLNRADGFDTRFQWIWQQTMEAIEGAFETVNARVDEVAILARLAAVESLADAANDNAVVAQATAAQVSVAVEQTFNEIDPVYRDFYEDSRL